MVTKVSNTSGAEAHWLRETVTMGLHVWDERSGHSTERLDAVIRETELMFDHQSLVDLDAEYASARCWFEGRTRVQEGGEKDNVVHIVLTMSIIAYRQFMVDVLASE